MVDNLVYNRVRLIGMKLYNITYWAACGGLIVSLCLITYISLGNTKLNMLSMIMGVFFACLVFIIFRNRLKQKNNFELHLMWLPFEKKNVPIILSAVIFSLLSLCFLANHFLICDIRLIFGVIIMIVVPLISMNIFLYNSHHIKIMILLEILMAGLFLRCTTFFKFATIQGIDAWAHMDIINYVADSGHIIANSGYYFEVIGRYQSHPCMHIFGAILSVVPANSPHISMFLIGITGFLLSIFLYLFIRSIYNEKIALLALLLFSLVDSGIYWTAVNIIPMSFSVFYLSMILYFLFLKDSLSVASKIVVPAIIFVYILIVFTHPLAALGVLMVCSIVLVAFTISGKFKLSLYSNPLMSPLFVLILMWLLMISHLIYIGGFDTAINFLKLDLEVGGISGIKMTDGNISLSMWRFLPLGVYGFFSVLGTLLLYDAYFNKQRHGELYNNEVVAPIVTCFWIFTMFIFILFVMGKDLIIFDRWVVWIYILLLLPCVIGFISVINIFKKYWVIALFGLVVFFSGTMILSDAINSPCILSPWSEIPRTGFLESEITPSNFIDNHVCDAVVYADLQYLFLLSNSVIDGSRIIDGSDPSFNGVLLLRSEFLSSIIYISNPDPSGTSRSEYRMPQSRYDNYLNNDGFNKIYESGSVIMVENSY